MNKPYYPITPICPKFAHKLLLIVVQNLFSIYYNILDILISYIVLSLEFQCKPSVQDEPRAGDNISSQGGG